MENFRVERRNNTSQEISMSVSPVCVKEGQKIAYVSFTDGTRTAEGEIPLCKIRHNEGFDEGEIAQLEIYMKGELETLKKMAASVNVADAFMGKTRRIDE
ncbi:MAG: hypothetical protein U0K68_01225 [Agathobacter sp.]|nr:hypothetical protein [Agathobacter sp.]